MTHESNGTQIRMDGFRHSDLGWILDSSQLYFVTYLPRGGKRNFNPPFDIQHRTTIRLDIDSIFDLSIIQQ
jgi:hypothetical protein